MRPELVALVLALISFALLANLRGNKSRGFAVSAVSLHVLNLALLVVTFIRTDQLHNTVIGLALFVTSALTVSVAGWAVLRTQPKVRDSRP